MKGGSITQKTWAAPISFIGADSAKTNLTTTDPTNTIAEGTTKDTNTRIEDKF